MKWSALLALPFLASCVAAQSTRDIVPPTVVSICGRLMHYEIVATNNDKKNSGVRSKVLRHASIYLYVEKVGSECCDGLSLAAKATTSKSGAFDFGAQNLANGRYWMVAKVNSRKYKLLVQYDSKGESDQLCNQMFWLLDGRGHFWKQEAEPPF